MANEVATVKQSFVDYVGNNAVKQNIIKAIGEKDLPLFVTPIVSAVQQSPLLAACTPASIISGGLAGYALKLAPSPQIGHFYLVPHKSKKNINGQWVEVQEATFQLGWKGYIQLAIRSGQYEAINVSDVRKGELKSYNPITEEMSFVPVEDPAAREKLPVIGYYARFKLLNGFQKQLFFSVERMKEYAKSYSDSYRYDLRTGKKSSPWSNNFDEMAKKTMIRQLIGKWGIMSIEMQKAYTQDMSVIDDDGNPQYVDNQSSFIVEEQVQEDISANANTVAFEEAVVEPAPEPEKPKSKTTPKKNAAKKEPTPAPMPEPEVETVIDIAEADDDEPDWA